MSKTLKKLTVIMLALMVALTGLAPELTVNAAADNKKTLKVLNSKKKEIDSIDVIAGKTVKVSLVSYTGAGKTNTTKKASSKSKKTATVKVSKSNAAIKGVKIGTTTVTFKDSKGASKKLTVNVTPNKINISKTKRNKSGSVTLSWKADKAVTGYEIYRSYDKNTYKKIKTVTNKNTTSYTDKCKDDYTYYKIRSYKKIKNKKIYGPYSSVKKVANTTKFYLEVTGYLEIKDSPYKEIGEEGSIYKVESTGESIILGSYNIKATCYLNGEEVKTTYTLDNDDFIKFQDHGEITNEIYGLKLNSERTKAVTKGLVYLTDSGVETNCKNGTRRVKLTATAKVNGKTYKDSMYLYVVPDSIICSRTNNGIWINTDKNVYYEVYKGPKDSEAKENKYVETYKGKGEQIRPVYEDAEKYDYVVRAYIMVNGKKYYGMTHYIKTY